MKNILNIVKTMLALPALFLHEMAHVIACIFTLRRIFNIKIHFSKNCVGVDVIYHKSNKKFTETLISMAPIVMFVFIFIVGFFTSITITIYAITFSRTMFPSKRDFENVKNAGKFDPELDFANFLNYEATKTR